MSDRNRDEVSRSVSSSSVDDSVDYLCAFTGGEVRRNLRKHGKDALNKAMEEKRAALELNPYWKDGGNGLPPENCAQSSFKKPKFLNDDDCRYGKSISDEVSGSSFGAFEIVKAKPLQPKLARKLANEYDHRGKDFVRPAIAASSESNLEASERNARTARKPDGKLRDELNKLKAKLFRAEMMGDHNEIKSIKEAIEHFKSNDSTPSEEKGPKEVLLTKVNIRKGTTFLVDPVDNEKRDLNVRDMLKKEKMMTDSEDFDVYHFPIKNISEKHTEDWTVDDIVLSRMQKAGSSKQAEKIRAEQIRDLVTGWEYLVRGHRHARSKAAGSMPGLVWLFLLYRHMTASTTAGAALFTNLNDNGRPGAGSTPIQPTGKKRCFTDAQVQHALCSLSSRSRAEILYSFCYNIYTVKLDFRRQEQKLDTCTRCVEGKLDRHFVIAFGNQTYLALPKSKPLVRNHCLIAPLNHVSSCAQMDENVLEEIRFWREKLVAMFRTQSLCCIFFETAKNVKHMPHCFLECVPVSEKIFECAPMYFKQAIMECEESCRDNAVLIDMKGKDVKRVIPAGFSYFVVYFGLEGGMAHIIENESLVPSWFGQEVIGGMLGLEYNQWRKPVNELLEEQVKRVAAFKKQLKEFDSTIFQK
ncbi:CWF19-like protein 2 [Trichinella pseudospiralis]|uniref:CWF19-like protein 2 n=1 Tax=Trichinella pseudospiralis TaxID=6337 RepID=A0A0V1IW87_TRIPS|nr:CWF19-like protein 2 [Trichinella pseudospiralis]KRZ41475.1 CWF19-like protein 2 [Trichinella pseudospiralis]